VDPGHGDGAVVVSWPALTLRPPQALGTCLAGSSWDPAAARLRLDLLPGRGCSIDVEES
jgi:hypothetical protein